MKGGARPRLGLRLVLAVARWTIWMLLGHPIGLSFFFVASAFSLQFPYALGLALLIDLLVVAIGSRLRAGRAVRGWCERTRAAVHPWPPGPVDTAEQTDQPRRSLEQNSHRGPKRSARFGPHRPRNEDGSLLQVAGWVIGLRGSTSIEGFESQASSVPSCDAAAEAARSFGHRRRARHWEFLITFGSVGRGLGAELVDRAIKEPVGSAVHGPDLAGGAGPGGRGSSDSSRSRRVQ